VNLGDDLAAVHDVTVDHPAVVKRSAETLRTYRAQGFSRG